MENKNQNTCYKPFFSKKINTEMYLILKNKYNFDVKLMCPKFHKDLNKTIYPDFIDDEINIDIFFNETIFNHLRFKIYRIL